MPRSQEAPAVVLVRPTEQGNVGSAARAMANTGLQRLILVEPAVEIGETAQAFAVGARPILEAVERFSSLEAALAPFQRVIGTTSSRLRSLSAPVIEPRELPDELAAEPPGTSVALVFGPERTGLNNEELALCSPLVCIPTSPRQPTLNLSQAVLIVAYELFVAAQPAVATRREPPAPLEEIEGLFQQLDPVLDRIGFKRDDTADAAILDLRRLAARSGPTAREVRILRGLCRRAAYALGLRKEELFP